MRAWAATALLCAIILSGCSKEPAAPDDEDDAGCSIDNCPPTSSSISSSTAANNTTSTSSSSTTTSVQPRAAVTHQKDVTDNAFPQGTFTIQKGDTVRWTHRGQAPHSVTSAGNFDSHPNCPPVCMVATQTFQHQFNAVGDFDYVCKVHGGMTGTITVVEALPA